MSTGSLRGVTAAVACAFVFASAAPALAETPGAPELDGVPGVLDAELSITEERSLVGLTAGGGVRLSAFVETPAGAQVVSFDTDSREDAEDAVALLNAQPSVAAAHVAGRVRATAGSIEQYGNAMVRSDAARAEVGAAISDVVVAVLDTGVGPHAELDGALLTGQNFTSELALDTTDHFGHGTHVAGTVGADLGSGVEGVAAGVRILPVKVLSDGGWGYTEWVAAGIVWAADNGADVINMSLGGSSSDEVMGAAVEYARSQGVTVVAAAGNDNSSAPHYPAAYPGVVAVSAVDAQKAKADFSNHGPSVDLAAPGVDIWSTGPGGVHWSLSGTSMASPHVAGVAALAKAVAPDLSPDLVEIALEGSATDLGVPGPDAVYGRGLVDAMAAVEAAEGLAATGTWPGNSVPVAPNRTLSSSRSPDTLTIDVLAGATDADGDLLEVTAFTQGARGNVARAGAKLSYEPFRSGPFTDTFTYTVHDGRGGRASATVTVTVGAPDPTDRAPVAKPLALYLPYGAAEQQLYLATDQASDPDRDPLRIVRYVQPAHGRVVLVDGDLWYHQLPGVWGTAVDTIGWTVTDGRGRYASSTVTISIRHPNAPPVATDTEVQVGAGATHVDFTVDATDAETDDDPFLRTLGTPAHGRASQLSATKVRYTLTDDLPVGATDSFSYTVGDQFFGEAEATVHVTVVEPRKPGAPSIGTASPGKASAVVRWSTPADAGNSAISGYVVRAYASGTLVRSGTAAATARSLTVTGLTNGRKYTFRVSATNVFGSGPFSSASGTVTPRTTPAAPKLGTVSPAKEALVVRWAAPSSNGGSAITGYLVRTYSGGYEQTSTKVSASARSLTVRNLVATAPYTVRVQAINAAGGGTWSAASAVVRPNR